MEDEKIQTEKEIKRKFTGVWIPAEIWLMKEINLSEKMMWAEISSLYDKDIGGCYASNDYLANFFNITERHVRRHLLNLKKMELVNIFFVDDEYDRSTRLLTAEYDKSKTYKKLNKNKKSDKNVQESDKNVQESDKNVQEVGQECPRLYKEYSKDNNKDYNKEREDTSTLSTEKNKKIKNSEKENKVDNLVLSEVYKEVVIDHPPIVKLSNCQDVYKEIVLDTSKTQKEQVCQEDKSDAHFSLSAMAETKQKVAQKKAPKSPKFRYESVLAVYQGFIFPRCSNATESILKGIPKAIKIIEKNGITDDAVNFLISAIKKYKDTDNFKWRKEKNYSLLAPGKFFSAKFVADNLIPIGDLSEKEEKIIKKTPVIENVIKVTSVDKVVSEEEKLALLNKKKKENDEEIKRSTEHMDYDSSLPFYIVQKWYSVDRDSDPVLQTYRIN